MKKYILFIFGYTNEQFVLETLADLEKMSSDIRFMTGDGYGIYHFESKEGAEEIKEVIFDYLEGTIQTLFIFEMNNNYSIEMDKDLKTAFLDAKFSQDDFEKKLKNIEDKYLDIVENEEEKIGIIPIKDLLKKHLDGLPERTLTVDIILDKILAKGIKSLTEREKDFLDNQRKLLNGDK